MRVRHDPPGTVGAIEACLVVCNMQIVADLHIHSKYSRATSTSMVVREISTFAELKGLQLVGTGDLTHPDWNRELKQELEEVEHTGILRLKDRSSKVQYVLSGEVCTLFESGSRSRRIHHVILAPDFETVDQIRDRLARFGDLRSDGRPMLSMSAAELVEETTSLSNQIFVFPAHIWTPWFSLFGAVGGFDSLEECYEDQSDRISAIETGLSSDPPMNWRFGDLDRLAIISNSDAHSPWPWRIGREATCIDLQELSYSELISAISSRKSSRVQFTIEVDPAYGKYHWTGHRNCGVSMRANDADKLHAICPKCGRKMTKGVDLRVEELADRPEGYTPDMGCVRCFHILPLHELIAAAIGVGEPSSKEVWEKYNKLVSRFGTELNVMLEAPQKELADEIGFEIADLIMKMRNNLLYVTPGYDGTYGRIDLKHSAPSRAFIGERNRSKLDSYL